MWTMNHNRCWTAERFVRRGLPHLATCPLCDQAVETIDHMKISCVFLRQFWFNILQLFCLDILTPQPSDLRFDDWWANSSDRVSGQVKKGLNSIIILGAWTLRIHRNHCVFDGGTPNSATVISAFKDEVRQWALAGAQGVSHPLALAPPVSKLDVLLVRFWSSFYLTESFS